MEPTQQMQAKQQLPQISQQQTHDIPAQQSATDKNFMEFLATVKDHQKKITELFQYCKYQEAQKLLKLCIQSTTTFLAPKQIITESKVILFTKMIDLLSNRASLYLAVAQFGKALQDCEECFNILGIPQQKQGILKYESVQRIMCMKINSLLKINKEKQALEYAEKCLLQFPYHKKLKDLAKLAKEKVLVGDEQNYLDSMFQKLCLHPQVRQYLKDEAFLTKVQRMIRNPSLTPALEKLDPRIKQASDAILMAEQNQP